MLALLLGIAPVSEQQVREPCQRLAQRLPSAINTSRLPLDLWLEIFPYLRADLPTLKNLSLACLFFRNMSIPHLFRSLVFPFPSSLRRAFRLLHSVYIHPYIESMSLTRPSKLDAMRAGPSSQVIILALLQMKHVKRLALDFPCPAELYDYVCGSKHIKQLLWTTPASKVNNPGRSQCRLEAVEFSDVGKKCSIPAVLMVASTSTLKSLSVHSSWYINKVWAFTRAYPFSNLTSLTFSGMDGVIARHVLRDILESCPSLTSLHFPTRLQYVFSLSSDALPKLNTLDAGPNNFLLSFLQGRPVRRLFTKLPFHFFFSRPSLLLQNSSFSLLHMAIKYSLAEKVFSDVNRALIYCKDLALTVWIDDGTPSGVAVTTMITGLPAPSLVDLSLVVQARVLGVVDIARSRRLFETQLRDACGGSPNLQQLTVGHRVATQAHYGFHARRLSAGEWAVRSSVGRHTKTSWFHTEMEVAETEEGSRLIHTNAGRLP